MPLGEDLYKFLLEESKLCREKVSTIWLQKFTMLGAIIAFAATRAEADTKNPGVVAGAILSLPLAAVLLDVKLAEFGIHARVIDDFIIRNYSEPHVLSDWERTKWGDSDNADRTLIRLRSIATVAVTVVPTCVIAFLSVLVAEPLIVSKSAHSYLRMTLVVFCLTYLGLSLICGFTVLFRGGRPANKRAG